MVLFVRQQEQRSELQERVAAELREKLKQNAEPLEYEKPTNDIEMRTHESQILGPIVAIVGALVALGVAYLLFAR
jgi:hypothetical protein